MMLKNILLTTSIIALSSVVISKPVKAATDVGAGVFLIAQGEDGEHYTFLGKRKNGSGWVNPGGLRDPEDGTVEEAAARETFEESMGLIKLSPTDLAYAPYADYVSLSDGSKYKPKKRNYRMYFHKTSPFSVQPFHNRLKQINESDSDSHLAEMKDFGWFRLKDIMAHFTGAGPLPEFFEAEDMDHQKRKIKIYAPLVGMLRQQRVLDYYKSLTSTDVVDVSPAKDESHKAFNGKLYKYSQSEAHLKLVLGDKYVESNITANIDTFLKDFHDPVYAKRKAKAKKDIKQQQNRLANESDPVKREAILIKIKKFQDKYDVNNIDNQQHNKYLKSVLVKALEAEKENTDKVVLYHGTEAHINFLYDVITEFRKQLFNLPGTCLKIVRAIDDFFKDISSIQDFEHKMDEQELLNTYVNSSSDDRVKYNYLPGYTNGGLSTNISLFGNHRFRGSSSFAYLLSAHSEKPAPSLKLLKNFFNLLGLDDEEMGSDLLNRLQEYVNVFLKHFSNVDKLDLMKKYQNNDSFLQSDDFAKVSHSKNGVMLQMFLTPEAANTAAHITEVVGDRIALKVDPDQHATTKPTEVIKSLRKNPDKFESILKVNHSVFQNQISHDRPQFDSDPNFLHANIMEARLLALPGMMSDKRKSNVNTFYLEAIDKKSYLSEIRALASRDVAQILRINPDVSEVFKKDPSKIIGPRVVNDLMMKSMVDAWKVDVLAEKNLINKSFKAKIIENGKLEERSFTPLTYALSTKSYDLVIKLIEKEANLDDVGGMSLKEVYEAAVLKDNADVAIKLLQKDSSLSVANSVLNDAIEKGALKTVQKILEQNIDSNVLGQKNTLELAIVNLVKDRENDKAFYKTFAMFKLILEKRPQLLSELWNGPALSQLEKALEKKPNDIYLKTAVNMIKSSQQAQDLLYNQIYTLLAHLFTQNENRFKVQTSYTAIHNGDTWKWQLPIMTGAF